MAEEEKKLTVREIADMALVRIGEELEGRHKILLNAKMDGLDPEERHTAFLAGMAEGIDLLGNGLIPSGDLTAGGPFTLCVEDKIYSKMEALLGRQIRPRKPWKGLKF